MSRSHITTFIVDGSDYFAAHLDNGRVCVGLIGNERWDVPVGHHAHDEIVACKTEADAEAVFDKYAADFL